MRPLNLHNLLLVITLLLCVAITEEAPTDKKPQKPFEQPELYKEHHQQEDEFIGTNSNEIEFSSTRNVVSNSSTTEIDITSTTKNRKYCFVADPKLCQTHFHQVEAQRGLDSTCQCRAHPDEAEAGYCCNITDLDMISSCNYKNWKYLHVFNMSMPKLDLGFKVYQHLLSLAITDGNMSEAINVFSRASRATCLNISNNNLMDINLRALSYRPNIEYLDLSRNNLTRIPHWNQHKNITVNIMGNRFMFCKLLTEAVLSASITFVDPDNSFCLLNNTFIWFNSTTRVSIRQLEMARRTQTDCPVIPGYGSCKCTVENIQYWGNLLTPSTQMGCYVDCFNMSLTELPPKLPENTFTLNVSNNKITNIVNYFHDNPTYSSIVRLYADNNRISSISELGDTIFMKKFQHLHLRNNTLTKIPAFMLSNKLEADVGRDIYLGGNEIECDCSSVTVTKFLLIERSRDIPDYSEILCRNIPYKLVDLKENLLCQTPHDWTYYIYYLIAAEVFMLVALITKVSYDYWIFKTAGYLPWPANKMPKLPCDWLCE